MSGVIYLATGRAEAGLAGKRDAEVILTARTGVACVTGIGVATEQHALDDRADIGALIVGDLIYQAQITPAIPMAKKDLAETVMSGRVVEITPYGRGREAWRLRLIGLWMCYLH